MAGIFLEHLHKLNKPKPVSECVSLVWLESNTFLFISSECTWKFRNEVLKLIFQEKDEEGFFCVPGEISMSLLIKCGGT